MTPNERIIVLELLKEGKISTETAEQLLAALSRTERARTTMDPRKRFEEAFQRVEREFRAIDLSEFEKKMSGFFEEMRRRFPDMPGKPKRSGASEKSGESESGGFYQVSKNASVNIAQKGGSVSLFGADGDQVRVEGAKVNVSQDSSRMEIDSVGGTLHVGVPDGIQRVYIDASGSQIEAFGAKPKDLTARASGGSVRVMGVEGVLRLRAVGGGVYIEHPASEDIEAETNGGSIEARLGDRTQGEWPLPLLRRQR